MPQLMSRQGNQLIFQNDDGSNFTVAADGLSPQYQQQLLGGMNAPQSPDPMQQIANLNNGGFSMAPQAPRPMTEMPAPMMGAQPVMQPPAEPQLPELPMAPEVAPELSPTEKAFGQMAAGIQQEQAAASRQATQSAQQYNQNAQMIEATQKRVQMIQEEGQKNTQKMMDQILQKQDEIEKMQIENPWANQSTGTKIASALVIGMGEQAAAFLGRENAALNIINKAIDDDVKLQMKRIDKAGLDLGNKKDYLSLVKQATNDQVTQELMLKTIGIEAAENKIKAFAETANSQKAKGQAQKLLGGLQLEKQKFEEEAFQRLVNIGKAQAEAQQVAKGDPELLIPGVGQALTKDDAKEAKKINAMAFSFNKTLDDAIALRKEFGSELTPFSAAAGKGQSIGSDLLLQVKDLGQLGVLSESDIEQVIKPLIPTNITELSPTTLVRLEKAKDFMNNRVQAFYKSRGITAPEKFLGIGEKKVLPNGAEFLLQEGQYIPQNDLARQIVEAQQRAKR